MLIGSNLVYDPSLLNRSQRTQRENLKAKECAVDILGLFKINLTFIGGISEHTLTSFKRCGSSYSKESRARRDLNEIAFYSNLNASLGSDIFYGCSSTREKIRSAFNKSANRPQTAETAARKYETAASTNGYVSPDLCNASNALGNKHFKRREECDFPEKKEKKIVSEHGNSSLEVGKERELVYATYGHYDVSEKKNRSKSTTPSKRNVRLHFYLN
jgi:hypothetical protein